MIHRFSSRTHKLAHSYLNDRLQGARTYDRIAGYFSSGMLELAGEALESMSGKVRVVCNSDLSAQDVETARGAELAQGREWRSRSEDKLSEGAKGRLARLQRFLRDGRLEVRVLPNEAFGLIHGKAGVITLSDGSRTAFMGSVNETYAAWKLNYEILWEDRSEEAADWVQEEFNALWNHPLAKPLSEVVLKDIERLTKRTVVDKATWDKTPEPASAVVETPVYRKEYGLWAHQKYFVKLAFDEHVKGRGARFVLADQVGLGKTVQLALAGMLMALRGDGPVLAIVPKTLMGQWQDELMKLLALPSAIWNGKNWVDEQEIVHPNNGPEEGILQCPRRFGIISQGLVVQGNEAVQRLLEKRYECVIVDECHRARRRNLGPNRTNEDPEPNNLMAYLLKLSSQCKSMLLATATPVQLYPIEAYDLVNILAQGAEHVLGDEFSKWRMQDKARVLERVRGDVPDEADLDERWLWIRDPFPPEYEHDLFARIRSDLDLKPTDFQASVNDLGAMKPWLKNELSELPAYSTNHNPLLRHIVRRTRSFLEETIDPNTGEPYLKKVEVVLYGEDDPIILPTYLHDAYETAEEFCAALKEIMKTSGFLRTMLLRRMGSSIEAGKRTAFKLLNGEQVDEEDDEQEENTDQAAQATSNASKGGVAGKLTEREQTILRSLIQRLNQYQEKDPKLLVLRETLFDKGWAEEGCIIFSQYYDTAAYFAEQIALERPDQEIAIYAGSDRSGIWHQGRFLRQDKDTIKKRVQSGGLKLVFGTDSASEGLNLQRLGTLINLDLPWNPTRLEQRKGRIQRIGQARDQVKVYNMRYKDSVEDRVHEILSERLQHINELFGQIPDVLQDAWVEAAEGRLEKAKELIDGIPEKSPFELRYDRIESVDFETCATVLNEVERTENLKQGW
ncbi:MAG: DEAD/DEAH box helicase family protein [Flavobacteriales bacterium]|nr:DEAD/DEAH box helicase family protein [Flavobacteriales bacterium]